MYVNLKKKTKILNSNMTKSFAQVGVHHYNCFCILNSKIPTYVFHVFQFSCDSCAIRSAQPDHLNPTLYEFFEWPVQMAEILAMFLAETMCSRNVSLRPVCDCLFLSFPEDHSGFFRNRM